MNTTPNNVKLSKAELSNVENNNNQRVFQIEKNTIQNHINPVIKQPESQIKDIFAKIKKHSKFQKLNRITEHSIHSFNF